MIFFRRTLSCFYCGESTGKKWDRSINKFQCRHCEAENYLDENGDITEPQFDSGASTPPIAISASQNSFAHSFSSAPPELSLDSSAIFCRTCTHNQRFQAESLANYLPSTSDPRYNEFERNLPAFRRELEERYPQVCADCVDKANKRLKTATYAASADNLRRGTLKTRQVGIVERPERRGMRLAIWAGVWTWRLSLLLQILWNIVGLLPVADELVPTFEHAEVMMLMPQPTVYNCLRYSKQTLRKRSECDAAFAQIALFALMLSFASAWAHPSLSRWIKSKNSRLIGYGDFAILQVTILAMRVLGWWLLMNPSESKLARKLDFPLETLHAFMLVLNIVLTFVGASMVQVQRKILYPFDQPIPEITAPPGTNKASQTKDASAHDASRSAFLLSRLDPLSALRLEPAYLAEDMFDDTTSIATDATTSVATHSTWQEKMEWEPTEAVVTATSFHPNPPARFLQSQRITHSGPSPFRGTLPPAPEPPAHRLRKPKAPAFKAASDISQNNFFKGMGLGGPGNEGRPSSNDVSSRPELAQGSFQFAGKQADTGLEDLFGQSFGIKDHAGADVDGGNVHSSGTEAVGSRTSFVPVLMLGGFCVLGMLFIAAGLLEKDVWEVMRNRASF